MLAIFKNTVPLKPVTQRVSGSLNVWLKVFNCVAQFSILSPYWLCTSCFGGWQQCNTFSIWTKTGLIRWVLISRAPVIADRRPHLWTIVFCIPASVSFEYQLCIWFPSKVCRTLALFSLFHPALFLWFVAVSLGAFSKTSSCNICQQGSWDKLSHWIMTDCRKCLERPSCKK